MLNVFVFGLLLQQHPVLPTGNTTPASGDTVGYWQQRVAYTITATLDESTQRVRARGTLRYVNNSPDTLREMYLHQYLNAFRPGSRWSAVDAREGRVRFQNLREPDYGYERFTAPVRVDGVAVTVDYPGAPDSTVAHLVLPAPILPGDSVLVDLAWDARPSTVPRRQGRRGRHWDLAQWYPKVAVYDRAGWEFNALQPAGELYGEFGTYDVSLVVANDQVIGATGIPVAGDPGWAGATRHGAAREASGAYGAAPVPPTVVVPTGYKVVRFLARDVHHFAWSASPNYRYEGGVYVREATTERGPMWDTVSIHALYVPGDDSTWGGGRVVARTINALRWLEQVYGPYAYPQLTVLHRIDGGGTEFPMMLMNGSPSQGLILHEGGHVFTYGILANNEWRSGWMDEGLTSYQTDWAEQNTAPEVARLGVAPAAPAVKGYRSLGIRMALTPADAFGVSEALTDLDGRSQPIGTRAQDFRDFGTYNGMIYDRAEVMYGQLRDVLGDSAFIAFLHDYYDRWKLKHVDERAMRASAERVSGKDLGWFFDQWVHHTGVTDYALAGNRVVRDSAGRYVTTVDVVRRGPYRHTVAVGVRTASGWTLARATDPAATTQTVRIITSDEPIETRLDPMHTSWDWNRLNDTPAPSFAESMRFDRARWNVDWPFLEQADRDHEVLLLRPLAWYSDVGGLNAALRIRASYLGSLDAADVGFAAATRASPSGGLSDLNRYQYWARLQNPLFFRPAMGWSGGLARLDDIDEYDVGFRRDVSSSRGARTGGISVTFTRRPADAPLIPELWTARQTLDVAAAQSWKAGPPNASYFFASPSLVAGRTEDDSYAKIELPFGRIQTLGSRTRLGVRAYLGAEENAPGQRALFISSRDPVTTFTNHWWRPAGAVLKRPGVGWLPLGGAAMRGYRWDLAADRAVGGNVDLARQLKTVVWARGRDAALTIRGHAFGDGATVSDDGTSRTIGDAGVGVSVSGRLYDRPVFVRIDSPFYVSDPALAIDRGHAGSGHLAPRWTITFNDVW